ncbi:hypothetical protein C8R45DRAFT_531236 [Mycena sanguinolenta]|nr:hypothetical protein C8R45DRAFT_531236 [Mycena sanguinolenta]
MPCIFTLALHFNAPRVLPFSPSIRPFLFRIYIAFITDANDTACSHMNALPSRRALTPECFTFITDANDEPLTCLARRTKVDPPRTQRRDGHERAPGRVFARDRGGDRALCGCGGCLSTNANENENDNENDMPCTYVKCGMYCCVYFCFCPRSPLSACMPACLCS